MSKRLLISLEEGEDKATEILLNMGIERFTIIRRSDDHVRVIDIEFKDTKQALKLVYELGREIPFVQILNYI